MKLFVLSFAVCITAASVSAQSASPTPLSATPPTDATHNVAPSFVVARPGAPQIKAAEPAISPAAGAAVNTAPGAGAVPATQPPGQMIPAASSSITVDAHIESRSIDSSSVGRFISNRYTSAPFISPKRLRQLLSERLRCLPPSTSKTNRNWSSSVQQPTRSEKNSCRACRWQNH